MSARSVSGGTGPRRGFWPLVSSCIGCSAKVICEISAGICSSPLPILPANRRLPASQISAKCRYSFSQRKNSIVVPVLDCRNRTPRTGKSQARPPTFGVGLTCQRDGRSANGWIRAFDSPLLQSNDHPGRILMLQTIESANADSFRGLRCNNSSRQIIYSLKEGRRKRPSSGRRWYARPQSSDGHHAVAAKAPTGGWRCAPQN